MRWERKANVSEEQLSRIKEVGDKQLQIFDETGEYPEDAIMFEFEGIDIINPFLDEMGTDEVDPVEYYGEAFLNSDFMKIK